MPAENTHEWSTVLAEIARTVKKQQLDTWFRQIDVLEIGPERIALGVPNKFIKGWLQTYYQGIIADAARKVLQTKPEIRFTVQAREEAPTPEPSLAPAPADVRRPAPPPAPTGSFPQLNPDYTFDNFVVGPSNRLAHAASLAVAEAPAAAYNPLFLHGPVGLGKTHLLQAICRHLVSWNPNVRVQYVSCEEFVNEFITAIREGRLDRFRRKHRTADVLMIDDIHFLASKNSSQEEFFHTFNSLFNAQKQIILSSDSAPADIPTIEERLISRFKWGLVAPIDPPNLETRIAILTQKAEMRGHALPDDVVMFLAQQIDTNIRELEGAVTKLLGHATLENREIDMLLIREAFPNYAPKRRRISIEDIQGVVTKHFDVKLSDLQSKKRTRSVTVPRQICMYLARIMTGHSLEEIGGFFGGRDHTTVMHACEQVGLRVKRDGELAGWIEETIQGLQRQGTD